jgi:hypothetical protein
MINLIALGIVVLRLWKSHKTNPGYDIGDPERYGIAKDAAEKQVDEFTRSYSSDDSAKAAKSS